MAVNKGGHIDFRSFSAIAALEGTAGTLLQTAAQTTTGADTTHDVYNVGGNTLSIYHASAATNWIADATARGWGLPCDATNNEGVILTLGNGLGVGNSRYCFTVGTDPAFFMRFVGYHADPTVADAIGDCAFFAGGFRTAGAYSANNAIAEMTTQALMVSDADATPFGSLAMVSCAFTAGADCYTLIKNSSAAGTATDTTQGEADGVAFTYEVRVSAAGAVTFYKDGALTTAGSTGTITAGVVLQPSIVFVNGATASAEGGAIVQSITWGLL